MGRRFSKKENENDCSNEINNINEEELDLKILTNYKYKY